MNTKRMYAFTEQEKKEALTEAVKLLRQGEIIAFPTETVYGLGANAFDYQACAKIFVAKSRPADNPLIVHVSSVEEAKTVVREWPLQAEICAREFWPGPLTLVLPKAGIIPDIVSAGLKTVAVRMPDHPLALKLIEKAGFPIAAPSANISGKPSPTNGEHVWQDLAGKIPLLIDAGKCQVGLESTVLDLSGEIPLILRPGGVTFEQLRAILGKVEIVESATDERPRAPGIKYRHYAPGAEIVFVAGNREEKTSKFAELLSSNSSLKIAILCFEETAAVLKGIINKVDFIFTLGSEKKPSEAARRLFEGLRSCDQEGIELILAERIDEQGIGLALMNRLLLAAGKRKEGTI
ncbi:MAG: L-threonylcarbamoyladenylate synthase [Desulfitobacteriia bacterium]